MASNAAVEAVLLLAVALLFPLRFISLALRPRLSAPRRTRSAAGLFAIIALVTVIYAVPDAGTRPGATDADALRSEVEALRLKVARLESILEENTKALNSKDSILEEDSKLIEAMEHDIQLLVDGQESTKNTRSVSSSADNIKDMEDEVQELQQEVSKINSNAHTIESLARDAEKRVEALSSEVKKIEDIIAEQWIQIRQFEQAFVLTKMMTSKVHERSKPSMNVYKWPGKDAILKYVSNVDLNGIFLRGASYARSCFSHAHKQSRSFVQAMNRYYYEVTRFGKAIRRQSIPDTDRPDVFFLGDSISKRSCLSLPYKQFKNSMSSAQKVHGKVHIFCYLCVKQNIGIMLIYGCFGFR
ncbi:hypothetical protein PR202_gb06960 [Eleusine coracana subsp. coracana]|uniref:Uncharacterized protein n=1 Tax=Eleusine coracana subsp. coracana TaxID=191504 RepID=A0AAV5EAV0_ELECO|nr:hypothetical protein PR202_gb06960 [Eleusine coracana subsp. coracana]